MDKEQIAFERLKIGEQMSHMYYQKPLMLCYSGGKDSDVLVQLAINSGIDFEIVHSHTTADAPETVRYIRDRFKEWENKGIKCSIEYPYYKNKRVSMWTLIPQKKMPPTRIVRYCCSILKETSGKNRAVATGVRWAESNRRANTRGVYEDINKNKDKRIILNNDNDDKRRLFERCELKAKTVVNPIIDWKDNEVWDYIKDMPCNPLYQEGHSRVGCIGCPNAGKKRYAEFRKYPQYEKMYIKAFDRMLANRDKKTNWQTGYDVFRWWLEENPDQYEFTDDMYGDEE